MGSAAAARDGRSLTHLELQNHSIRSVSSEHQEELKGVHTGEEKRCSLGEASDCAGSSQVCGLGAVCTNVSARILKWT
jgi:hypothetical protein